MPSPHPVTNLGLAGAPFFAQLEGDFAAFDVSEYWQGKDLNGDGDLLDWVPHVFDAATGITTNVGYEGQRPILHGSLVMFETFESRQGNTDLNGDGDTSDIVVHVFDASTGTLTNLGAGRRGDTLSGDGGLVGFSRSEADHGNRDLNGDGDTSDDVVHVFDASTGTITNLGLAGTYPRVGGTLVAVAVRESQQGNRDLNRDRDSVDQVLHVHDTSTGITANLGVDVASLGVVANRAFFTVRESRQGYTDLNGDGDTVDWVAYFYDGTTRTLTNLGRSADWSFGVGGRLRAGVPALRVVEAADGGKDLNGDGDATDLVLHAFDPATLKTINVGINATTPDVDGSLFAFSVSEAGEGNTDLNGDGDTADHVAHVYDVVTGNLTNIGVAASLVHVDGSVVCFDAPEARQGNTDLNGDGDVDDSVVHVFDVTTGTIVNTRLEADTSRRPAIHVDAPFVAFRTREAAQGAQDLNGDGDATDSVLHVFDADTGLAANVGLALPWFLELDGMLVLAPVGEGPQGHTDLNGDGDSFDIVLHVVSLNTQGRIGTIADAVEQLVDSGSLADGLGVALTSKLDAAVSHLDEGNSTAAKNLLQAFVRQVNALSAQGTLTEEEAQMLIAAANAILAVD